MKWITCVRMRLSPTDLLFLGQMHIVCYPTTSTGRTTGNAICWGLVLHTLGIPMQGRAPPALRRCAKLSWLTKMCPQDFQGCIVGRGESNANTPRAEGA